MTTNSKNLIEQLLEQQSQIETVRTGLLEEDMRLSQQRYMLDTMDNIAYPYSVRMQPIKDANWLVSTAIHRAYRELSMEYNKIQLHIEELCRNLESETQTQLDKLNGMIDNDSR